MGSERFDHLPSITEKKNVTKAMFDSGLLAPNLIFSPY